VIRLAVMLYVRFPLSLRNVEDLLFEQGIDACHETARPWWNRFGPLFAASIRRQRANRMRGFQYWRRHLDNMYVKINGEMHYLWRAVDHQGEVLESYVTRKRDKSAALRSSKNAGLLPLLPLSWPCQNRTRTPTVPERGVPGCTQRRAKLLV